MEPTIPAVKVKREFGLMEFAKESGRKFMWGYAALFALWSLSAMGNIKDDKFEFCFDALVVALIAGNYGEHREKQRAAAAGAPAAALETK